MLISTSWRHLTKDDFHLLSLNVDGCKNSSFFSHLWVWKIQYFSKLITFSPIICNHSLFSLTLNVMRKCRGEQKAYIFFSFFVSLLNVKSGRHIYHAWNYCAHLQRVRYDHFALCQATITSWVTTLTIMHEKLQGLGFVKQQPSLVFD